MLEVPNFDKNQGEIERNATVVANIGRKRIQLKDIIIREREKAIVMLKKVTLTETMSRTSGIQLTIKI